MPMAANRDQHTKTEKHKHKNTKTKPRKKRDLTPRLVLPELRVVNTAVEGDGQVHLAGLPLHLY